MANNNHATSCHNELNTMEKILELARVLKATASVHHYHSIMKNRNAQKSMASTSIASSDHIQPKYKIHFH
jgi:hypothetical protein